MCPCSEGQIQSRETLHSPGSAFVLKNQLLVHQNTFPTVISQIFRHAKLIKIITELCYMREWSWLCWRIWARFNLWRINLRTNHLITPLKHKLLIKLHFPSSDAGINNFNHVKLCIHVADECLNYWGRPNNLATSTLLLCHCMQLQH